MTTVVYAPHPSDSLKMIRETLCLAQSAINRWPADEDRKPQHIARLGRLIDNIDRQRPLGPDGKHGDRHTSTCGCGVASSSDGEVATPDGVAADLAPAQPGEDTTPCPHAPFDFCLCNPMTEFQRKAAQAQKLGYCEEYVRASADPEDGEGCPELRIPGSIHCEGHGGTTP